MALLVVCLAIALGFEFVNGFHDTANAVATVIYTKSLKPGVAVVWSGLMNFAGVFTGTILGGAAVAYSIVHLLPVDLLIHIGASAGILMVLSLLLSAIIWNIGTWYFGLPSSSSHALIGSILGVGLASSLYSGQGFGSGVNWKKATEVGEALLLSPLIGFALAACLLLLLKLLVKNPALYQEPKGDAPPPFWIRAILCLTCTGVSFFHGSNDGQKGVGLIMLILIGILPAKFAVDSRLNTEKSRETVAVVRKMEAALGRASSPDTVPVLESVVALRKEMEAAPAMADLPEASRSRMRADILTTDSAIGGLKQSALDDLSAADKDAIKQGRKSMNAVVDFVVPWVVVAVALALGLGTMIGWKRIVVTVGEKIGKTHLTYAQGASAELVAMVMILTADTLGLPVSTTHVLSSGIAGTMAANRSGLQTATLRNIALAWVLTLPVTMLLAGGLFLLTAGGSLKQAAQERDRQPLPPVQGRVLRKVE